LHDLYSDVLTFFVQFLLSVDRMKLNMDILTGMTLVNYIIQNSM